MLFSFNFHVNMNLGFADLNIPNATLGIGLDLSDFEPDITLSVPNLPGISPLSFSFLLGSCSAYLGSATLPGITFEPLVSLASPTEVDIDDLNASLSLGGLASFSVSNVDVTYTYNDPGYTIALVSGSANPSIDAIATASLSTVMLGGEYNGAEVDGFQYTNGHFTELDATINSGSINLLGLGSATITSPLSVYYDLADLDLVIGGEVQATIGGLTMVSLDVDPDNPIWATGIVIQNGIIESLDASASGTITVAGQTLAQANLTIQYNPGSTDRPGLPIVGRGLDRPRSIRKRRCHPR